MLREFEISNLKWHSHFFLNFFNSGSSQPRSSADWAYRKVWFQAFFDEKSVEYPCSIHGTCMESVILIVFWWEIHRIPIPYPWNMHRKYDSKRVYHVCDSYPPAPAPIAPALCALKCVYQDESYVCWWEIHWKSEKKP